MSYLTDGIEAEPDEWHELLIDYLGPTELVGFVPDFLCVGERSPFGHQGSEHIPDAESIRRAPALTAQFEGGQAIQIARCHYCRRLIGRQTETHNRNPWASAMFYVQEQP